MTSLSVRVLIADDAASVRECSSAVLQLGGFDVTPCNGGAEAVALLRRDRYDIVIADEAMQPVDGWAVLRAALETRAATRVIITAAAATAQAGEQAMQSGAWYYLPKPFTATHLQILVGMAAFAEDLVPPGAARSGRAPLRLSATRRTTVLPIGRAPAFRVALDLARRVAPTDIPVLLTGETGSGKEVLAQFIHQHSRRATEPMVPINCSALPDGLCESELFGHRKGAFTDALRDKPGLLEIAHRGTLFLDEVLDMSRSAQAKLLRVMEDGQIRRVGSAVPTARVDVRYIAACNADPARAVRDGSLREDFYYRLTVVRLRLPPLRERVEDIPLLANLFLTTYWRRTRPGTPVPRLSKAAIEVLKGHPWRGNLRELQSVIEWATVSGAPGQPIEPEDLSLLGTDDARITVPPIPSDLLEESHAQARARFLADFESQYARWVVDRAAGDVAHAARLARVTQATLHRMMQRDDLDRPSPLSRSKRFDAASPGVRALQPGVSA